MHQRSIFVHEQARALCYVQSCAFFDLSIPPLHFITTPIIIIILSTIAINSLCSMFYVKNTSYKAVRYKKNLTACQIIFSLIGMIFLKI